MKCARRERQKRGLTVKRSARGRQKKRFSSKALCFRLLYPKIVSKRCGRRGGRGTRGRRGWGWMRSNGRRERRRRKERRRGVGRQTGVG
jgi:hypothetical protein